MPITCSPIRVATPVKRSTSSLSLRACARQGRAPALGSQQWLLGGMLTEGSHRGQGGTDSHGGSRQDTQ